MTSSLPSWIERILGIETGAGEGTVWRLDHTWMWPASVTLVVVVLAAAFVMLNYLRENPQARVWLRMFLASLRLAVLGLVLCMLAQFVLSLQRTGLPYIAVLVDDSQSMRTVDRYDDSERSSIEDRARRTGFDTVSRWNLAQTLLAERNGEFLSDLLENYKLRVYFVNGFGSAPGTSPNEILEHTIARKPDGDSTPLGTTIRGVLDDLRGSPPAAIVALTDGINTEGPGLADAAALARRRGVPLYFVGLGDDRPVRDIKLSNLLVDDAVFVGDVVYFEASVSAAGYAGRKVPVVLREKGKPEILAKTEVTLGPDGSSQQVRVAYRTAREGDFHYVVEVEPQEGEQQKENNREERTVRVRNEKIRVLLVQGEPSFEFRYLRNMLVRENTIELKTLLQNADLEHSEQDSTALRGMPVRREELFQYDVILLSDADPALFSPAMAQNLVDFVDRPGKGGSLIFLPGPKHLPAACRNTPLARLIPIDLATLQLPNADKPLVEGLSVQPTDLGLSSPSLQLGDTPAQTAEVWASLAPLYWIAKAPDTKPGTRVLAEYQGRDGRRWPVILLQYVGAGKVLFHATDETWRWRYRVGDLYFARYWIQTIRYLSRSKLHEGDRNATLSVDRREFRRGEAVQLRVRFADDRLAPQDEDGVTVVLENPGNPTQRVKLRRAMAGRGVFEASVDNPAVGKYHAWIAVPTLEGKAPSVDFEVLAPPGEFERLQMDSQEMQRAAAQTRGRFYTFSTADRLIQELPEGRQVPVESLPPVPLWNTWPVLGLVLLLLIAEWFLRKLGGMI